MNRPLLIAERTHRDEPGICWEFGLGGKTHNWAAHISFGRPAWWVPTAGVRRWSGITEWRAGWLLVAVQVARKARR